jgi:uncharacterized membrane protein AbrB (regulator of aidB expression)
MGRASILIAGVLMFLFSVPLALRKVPMNKYYGFRTSVSMKSAENWYAVNARAGRSLMFWSLAIVALGAAGWVIPEANRELYRRWSPFLVIGIVALAFFTIGAWSRRYLP